MSPRQSEHGVYNLPNSTQEGTAQVTKSGRTAAVRKLQQNPMRSRTRTHRGNTSPVTLSPNAPRTSLVTKRRRERAKGIRGREAWNKKYHQASKKINQQCSLAYVLALSPQSNAKEREINSEEDAGAPLNSLAGPHFSLLLSTLSPVIVVPEWARSKFRPD